MILLLNHLLKYLFQPTLNIITIYFICFSIEYGIWNMEYGIWNMEYGIFIYLFK